MGLVSLGGSGGIGTGLGGLGLGMVGQGIGRVERCGMGDGGGLRGEGVE